MLLQTVMYCESLSNIEAAAEVLNEGFKEHLTTM